jgi:hypothetical protein
MHHVRIPVISRRSFSGNALSCCSGANVTPNGTSRKRRQMPLSVPYTTGRALLAITSLWDGMNCQWSSLIRRARIGSPDAPPNLERLADQLFGLPMPALKQAIRESLELAPLLFAGDRRLKAFQRLVEIRLERSLIGGGQKARPILPRPSIIGPGAITTNPCRSRYWFDPEPGPPIFRVVMAASDETDLIPWLLPTACPCWSTATPSDPQVIESSWNSGFSGAVGAEILTSPLAHPPRARPSQ